MTAILEATADERVFDMTCSFDMMSRPPISGLEDLIQLGSRWGCRPLVERSLGRLASRGPKGCV